jgi:hypothetical protein
VSPSASLATSSLDPRERRDFPHCAAAAVGSKCSLRVYSSDLSVDFALVDDYSDSDDDSDESDSGMEERTMLQAVDDDDDSSSGEEESDDHRHHHHEMSDSDSE